MNKAQGLLQASAKEIQELKDLLERSGELTQEERIRAQYIIDTLPLTEKPEKYCWICKFSGEYNKVPVSFDKCQKCLSETLKPSDEFEKFL